MKPRGLQWKTKQVTAMNGGSTLKRFGLALAAIAVGVVLGLTGYGRESWAQAPATAGAGATQTGPVVVKVEGEVSTPLRLTAVELSQLPRQSVIARAHDEKESRFEGVALFDVLKKAGLPTGKDLRGKAVTLYLVVEAADGYRAVFALPELDPAFTDRVILLADRRDGQGLSSHDGPLQIVVPGEKRHARWVRQVIALRIGRA
jgi:DMSO/TMAO reductase YedYZ molybdopterin-dependent catalytic subunit